MYTMATVTLCPPRTVTLSPNFAAVRPRPIELNHGSVASSAGEVNQNKQLAARARPARSARKKRNLGPGCGMLDWIRLCRSGKDLTGIGGAQIFVTEEELEKHSTPEDGWTVIRGKVYNITPYFKFHPGGKEELMKALGKDCTDLFDEAHNWVRAETMLAKCLVGTYKPRRTSRSNSSSSSLSVLTKSLSLTLESDEIRAESHDAEPVDEPDGTQQNSPGGPMKVPFSPVTECQDGSKPEEGSQAASNISLPVMRLRRPSDCNRPNVRMDWSQSVESVIISLVVHSKLHYELKSSDFVLDIHNNKKLEGTLFIRDWCYEVCIELSRPVESSRVEVVTNNKMKIHLRKQTDETEWESIGIYQQSNGQMDIKGRRVSRFHKTTVDSIQDVSHDTKLYTLQLPSTAHLVVPTGHHVTVRHGEVERSYTPVLPLTATQCNEEVKSLRFMIKLYEHGVMSKYLSSLCIGDSVWVSDPEGSFDVSRLLRSREIALIAAGTGFTPMAKIICDINKLNENDSLNRTTKLVFANKTESDILWKDELSAAQNVEVTHVLSKAESSWTGLRGRVSDSLLKKVLPQVPHHAEKDRLLVCVCGPSPFTESVSNMLLDLNYHEDCIHLFS